MIASQKVIGITQPHNNESGDAGAAGALWKCEQDTYVPFLFCRHFGPKELSIAAVVASLCIYRCCSVRLQGPNFLLWRL